MCHNSRFYSHAISSGVPSLDTEKMKEQVKEDLALPVDPDYDADFALAMQLQAELNQQSFSQSPSSSNEKGNIYCSSHLLSSTVYSLLLVSVSVQRAVPLSPLRGEYMSVLDDEDEDEDDYDDEFNERYNNPHMPTNYTGGK